MNNIIGRAAAGKIIAGFVKALENSEAVCLPDALSNLVANIARLEIRENQDVGPPRDRAALGLARSDFRDERGIELELAVKKKIRRKLMGYLHCPLDF